MRSAGGGSEDLGPAASQAVLEVDLGAVVANWIALQAQHPSGPAAAVIKADAYGLGARKIAAALHAAGCRHFFVAYLPEALAVRDVVPDAMLAVLCGLLPGTEADYMTHHLTPVLGALAEIERWAEQARSLGQRLGAILHLDTGMSRLGLDDNELAILADDHSRLQGLTILYVMTHLLAAENPADRVNQLQLERFVAARGRLPPAPTSLANSSGIFLGADFASDLARPGAALYGVNPTPGRPNPMRDTVRLMVRVLAVRDVRQGATVGYNGTWVATRPSRIATAAFGYADGFHRSLSNRGAASFDGSPVRLVGRVSMDLTTFDVTDHPAVQPGSWLEILGPNLAPDDVAAAAGTNGYEVLTSLGRRFHRVYRTP
jgi:alanine racemase